MKAVPAWAVVKTINDESGIRFCVESVWLSEKEAVAYGYEIQMAELESFRKSEGKLSAGNYNILATTVHIGE